MCQTTSRLQNKSILITGGNVGLGKTTAEECAKAGAAYIVLLCRNTMTAVEVEKSARALATHPTFRIETVACDLGDLKTVRDCAGVLSASKERFDVLFLNAGVMMVDEGKTVDGFETHIGINHFGHFLLTNLILKANLLNEGARVVALSSMAQKYWPKGFRLDDLNWERRKYSSSEAYSASKSANVLMMQELQRKFDTEGKGRIATAVHPGFVRTKLTREESFAKYFLLAIFPLYWLVSLSPREGVQCSLYAATAPEVATMGGTYFENLKPATPTESSPDVAAALWAISEQKTGVTY